MKNIYFFLQKKTNDWDLKSHFNYGWILVVLTILHFSFSGYAQKNKDIIVRACTQEIGNGLYRVNFGYDNPTKKEVIIDENGSIIKSNNGKRFAKGLNKFKSGSVEKAFTMEFDAKGSVEWTVTSPSGRVHTVVANANSSHCPKEEEGFIFPVVGQGSGKYFDLIGMNLGSLTAGNAGDIPSEIIFQLSEDGQKVMIVIVPKEGKLQQVMDMLQNKYAVPVSDFLIDPVTIISENLSAIDVYFPISELGSLNLETLIVNFARVLFPSLLDSEPGGTVVSQGDSVQRSNIIRDSYRMVSNGQLVPLDGRGINIGVISNSFDTQPYTNGKSKGTIDAEQGDLPDEPRVEVFKEYPFGIASDEGRAMLHIAHDVAPGSRLGFYAGALTPRDIELGVNVFGEAGYHIVFDDLTFITEPFFGGGRTAQAIQLFTSKPGRSYFSAAGNFGNQASQDIFKSSSSAPVTNFLSSNVERAHVFGLNPDGTEDLLQKFHVAEPSTFLIVLQWDEGMASQENSIGAMADLDIYIVDDFGNLVVGNNRKNDNGDSTEILVFQATGTGDANIMITSANGVPDPNLAFRYIVFRSDGLEFLEYFGAPTISGQAMLPEVHAIAAVNYENTENPVPEYYSSDGGVLPDGFNAQVTLTAPDGVHTNVASIGQYKTGDIFPSFYGTSASVGHAAATMALLMSAQPSWYPDGLPVEGTSLTNTLADQAIQLFKQNASPAGDPNRAGAGFLNAEKAFKQIATQTPKLKVLDWDDTVTPSAEPFEVTILGDYFPNEPTVLLDGVELEIVSKTETEIIAKVPVFIGNPGLQVSAGSITPNTEAQAISDPLTFLEDGKLALNIIANDVSIEYGQDVNVTFTVEGLPEGETLESQGLPELKFSSAAVFPYPDINNYIITPYFEDELTEAQLNEFQFNYKSGILNVIKRDLFIKATDEIYTYGDVIDPILNYEYITEGIVDNDDFLLAIKNSHQLDYYSENTLALINSFKALVNEYDILALLNGGSWISSERTIENSFKALVNGMDIVNLNMEHFTDYIVSKENQDGTTNSFKALVNSFKALVNAEDLFNGKVSFENSFKALVNSSELGGEDDLNDYAEVFVIVREEDGSTDTEDRSISKLYSLDLITGLGVTNTMENRHFVYPGTFLNAMAANFNVTYGFGRMNILPAELLIETEDLLIDQGEILDENSVISTISGFVYNETLSTVFPDGIQYYFENAEGKEYEVGDVGVFDILIRDIKNYEWIYQKLGKAYVNPTGKNIRKIRTYLDCVEDNPNDPDGLNYIAHFRYDNPNSETIYIFHGEDNNLTGDASWSGITPRVFLPGENMFTILFDGNRLIWHLTSSDSTHKTSVSSEASSDSGKCDAKEIEVNNSFYEVYPNPVKNSLTIEQNISETSDVDIYNVYGILYTKAKFERKTGKTINIDMTGFPNGMYYVRIVGNSGVNLFNIIKE